MTLQRLMDWFYKPYARMIREYPHMAEGRPFECVLSPVSVETESSCVHTFHISIKVKEISFSYHVEKIFAVDIPALQHGNDGLIYTCVNSPYTPGSDHNMYVRRSWVPLLWFLISSSLV